MARDGGFRPPNFSEVSNPKKRAFLIAYSTLGTVTEAVTAANMRSAQSHYDWLRDDPTYPALWAIAQNAYCDWLVSQVRARALKSDILLMFETKKRLPSYREKFGLEHSGRIDSTQTLRDEAEALRKLSAEERAALRVLLDKAGL